MSEEYEQQDDFNSDIDIESGGVFDDPPMLPRGQSVIYLQTSDVVPRIEKKVKELSELLNLTYDETLIALHHFQWNTETAQNKFFDREPTPLKKVCGILPENIFKADTKEIQLCSICFEKKHSKSFESNICGHSVCTDCWSEYFKQKTKDYNIGAFIKCPFEKCNVIIQESFLLKYIKEHKEIMDLYYQKLCRSFCEDNKTIKHCPSPGCIYCVENVELARIEITCIGCKCLFCFRCGKEAHTPCSCKMVYDWDFKSSSESENLRWIQVNTKMCPKCRKPIEKNQGCNHMTCRAQGCCYEFCWLCMGDWKEHGNNTGGYYKCNKYEEMSQEEKNKKSKEIDKEKSMLEKYIFYYDRYHNNRNSQEKAKETLKNIDEKIKKFHDHLKLETSDLQFLSESAYYLVDARRILKYSYIYGFNLVDKKEKDLFEFNQSDFEKKSRPPSWTD